MLKNRIRKPKPQEGILATLSFTRKPFTEPNEDDVFQIYIPDHIYADYKKQENNIYVILKYFQDNYDPDSNLTPVLLDVEYLEEIERIQLQICEIDEEMLYTDRCNLIRGAQQSLYKELEERLKEFYQDFSIQNGDSFLKEYINSKE